MQHGLVARVHMATSCYNAPATHLPTLGNFCSCSFQVKLQLRLATAGTLQFSRQPWDTRRAAIRATQPSQQLLCSGEARSAAGCPVACLGLVARAAAAGLQCGCLALAAAPACSRAGSLLTASLTEMCIVP